MPMILNFLWELMLLHLVIFTLTDFKFIEKLLFLLVYLVWLLDVLSTVLVGFALVFGLQVTRIYTI